MLSSSSSSAGRGARRSTMIFLVLVRGLGASSALFLFLEGRAGGLLGDLAVLAVFGASRPARRSGPWRASRRDRGSRAAASSPLLSAFDQSMIALKVIGLSHSPQIIVSRPASMRLAMAISPSRREQLHRAHLAQVHAHRIVGAVDRLPSSSRRRGRAPSLVERIDLVVLGSALSSSSSSSARRSRRC